MALLEILKYPDPRLRTVAAPITHIDDALLRNIDDMYETMYHAKGLGLAATQVNIHQRLFVMDLSDERNQPICVINPEILSNEGTQDDHHGCLSVPAKTSDIVARAATLRIRGMNAKGEITEWEAEGTEAICIQHEIDHLNGKLYIDHFSRLKQSRIREKILKGK